MASSRKWALGGSLLLAVGLCAPVVSTPPSGAIAYWQSGNEPVFIVALMVATALLAASNEMKHILTAGLAAFGIVGFSFLRMLYVLTVSRRHIAEGTGNPETGLAEAVFASAHVMWGWAALFLGAALLMFAGWKSRRTRN
ncbi:MAG TPA: hypothetical protein VGD23_06420 [Sphingomicrobium sp.]